MSSLPLLDVGETLFLGDAMVLPTRVKLDPPSTKPLSANRDFWTDLNTMEVHEADAADAVEAMWTQTRGISPKEAL